MFSTRIIAALVLCALSASLGAQAVIVNTTPAVIGFVDISTNGGTQILPAPTNDSEHNVFTTVGNPMFPTGNVRIGMNGVAVAGTTTGEIFPVNQAIPAPGIFFGPTGIPAKPAILAFWDDLQAVNGTTSIWWKEQAGILTIMWKNAAHTVATSFITFEIQVFASPALGQPWIQMLYPDATFDTFSQANLGGSATIGYLGGVPMSTGHAPWGFNTASVPDGTVLTITPTMAINTLASGPGTLQFWIFSAPPTGPYFLAATTFAGAYPNGWFYGLDIPFPELMTELAAGFPFQGTISSSGDLFLGPFTGLPSGLTVYMMAFGTIAGSVGPNLRTQAVSYTIQ